MPKDRTLYYPIHVGKWNKNDLGFIGDDSGENISHLNPYYCELTGLYWAWKNLKYDYLGIVHYRRYFSLNKNIPKNKSNIDNYILNKEEIESLLEKSDVIVPKKRKYYIETLYSHYLHTFDGLHLDKAREVISNFSPEYLNSFDKVMKFKSGHMFNMFIMKKELVNDYLTWLFLILDNLFLEIDIKDLTPFEARLFGRVSEILFNVWLIERKLNVIEVPCVYTEKIDYFNKVKSFLEAKFLGKKYKKSF